MRFTRPGAATQTVDLVTATDKAAEDYIIGTIKEKFPEHAFIGEESSFTGPGGAAPVGALELADTPTWIIVRRLSHACPQKMLAAPRHTRE